MEGLDNLYNLSEIELNHTQVTKVENYQHLISFYIDGVEGLDQESLKQMTEFRLNNKRCIFAEAKKTRYQ